MNGSPSCTGGRRRSLERRDLARYERPSLLKGNRKDDAIALRAVQARRVEPNRPGWPNMGGVVETVRRSENLVIAARSIDRHDPRSHTRSRVVPRVTAVRGDHRYLPTSAIGPHRPDALAVGPCSFETEAGG